MTFTYDFPDFQGLYICNDFSKFVGTDDSQQDIFETICMTANTVVNQSVFHFFKVLSIYIESNCMCKCI